MSLTAFTRAVSPRLAECELTHMDRQPINAAAASVQHDAYEAALRAAGATVIRLPPLPDFPDSVFVEDTAVLLGRAAIITRPGAAARAGETVSTAAGLAGRFDLLAMEAGRLDGGDVLAIGNAIYIGTSSRTDDEGVAEFRRLAAPLGYTVAAVPLGESLHLKTAACFAGADGAGVPVLLFNPDWVDAAMFAGVEAVAVDPSEPFGANCLRVGETLIVAANAPRTRALLDARGFHTMAVDMSELQKAEAGLTCTSLIAD